MACRSQTRMFWATVSKAIRLHCGSVRHPARVARGRNVGGPELQPGQRLVECSSRMFRTKIHLGHAHRGEIVTVITEEGQSRILHDGTSYPPPRTTINEITRRRASGHVNHEVEGSRQASPDD